MMFGKFCLLTMTRLIVLCLGLMQNSWKCMHASNSSHFEISYWCLTPCQPCAHLSPPSQLAPFTTHSEIFQNTCLLLTRSTDPTASPTRSLQAIWAHAAGCQVPSGFVDNAACASQLWPVPSLVPCHPQCHQSAQITFSCVMSFWDS